LSLTVSPDHLVLDRFAGPIREQVEQMPGIRRRFVHAQVRPVAAPDELICIRFDERVVERADIGIVGELLRIALRRHLDPDPALAHERHQRLERLVVHALGDVEAAHVVEDDGQAALQYLL
jgi:hypothetical protein